MKEIQRRCRTCDYLSLDGRCYKQDRNLSKEKVQKAYDCENSIDHPMWVLASWIFEKEDLSNTEKG